MALPDWKKIQLDFSPICEKRILYSNSISMKSRRITVIGDYACMCCPQGFLNIDVPADTWTGSGFAGLLCHCDPSAYGGPGTEVSIASLFLFKCSRNVHFPCCLIHSTQVQVNLSYLLKWLTGERLTDIHHIINNPVIQYPYVVSFSVF